MGEMKVEIHKLKLGEIYTKDTLVECEDSKEFFPNGGQRWKILELWLEKEITHIYFYGNKMGYCRKKFERRGNGNKT